MCGLSGTLYSRQQSWCTICVTYYYLAEWHGHLFMGSVHKRAKLSVACISVLSCRTRWRGKYYVNWAKTGREAMLSLQSRRPKSIVIMHIKIAEVRGAGLKWVLQPRLILALCFTLLKGFSSDFVNTVWPVKDYEKHWL